MNSPIMVRGSLRAWDYILLFVAGGIFLTCAAVAAVVFRSFTPLLFAAVGAFVLGAGACVRHVRLRNRRWVEDTGKGFHQR